MNDHPNQGTQKPGTSAVTRYIDSLGSNCEITLTDLTHKLTMLLALTRPSRSADLANLNMQFRKYSPEGYPFTPTKLAKQSRQDKSRIRVFPGNDRLCPVNALRAYEERTNRLKGDETQVFIATIKPYKAVTSCTIARWLKITLTKSGINTDIFKAHSERSASGSTAANAGITTNDIESSVLEQCHSISKILL